MMPVIASDHERRLRQRLSDDIECGERGAEVSQTLLFGSPVLGRRRMLGTSRCILSGGSFACESSPDVLTDDPATDFTAARVVMPAALTRLPRHVLCYLRVCAPLAGHSGDTLESAATTALASLSRRPQTRDRNGGT